MDSAANSVQIRVMLADDHRLFRQGLAQICELRGGFCVVGETDNGRDAIAMARELHPDVILMDIRMPVLDGVQATLAITAEMPDVHVIVLTMHREDRFVFDAIKAGARGYLLKDVDADDLLAAIRVVHRGEALIDPIIASSVLNEFRRLNAPDSAEGGKIEQLTDGEMEVLIRVAQGIDNHEVAEELGLADSTVANRLRTIYQKLHVNNRTQAALFALKKGWVTLEE